MSTNLNQIVSTIPSMEEVSGSQAKANVHDGIEMIRAEKRAKSEGVRIENTFYKKPDFNKKERQYVKMPLNWEKNCAKWL